MSIPMLRSAGVESFTVATSKVSCWAASVVAARSTKTRIAYGLTLGSTQLLAAHRISLHASSGKGYPGYSGVSTGVNFMRYRTMTLTQEPRYTRSVAFTKSDALAW